MQAATGRPPWFFWFGRKRPHALTLLAIGDVDGVAIHRQSCFVQRFGQRRVREHHHAQVFGTGAELHTDGALLDWARAAAPPMLEHHPALAAQHIARWLGSKSDYLKA